MWGELIGAGMTNRMLEIRDPVDPRTELGPRIRAMGFRTKHTKVGTVVEDPDFWDKIGILGAKYGAQVTDTQGVAPSSSSSIITPPYFDRVTMGDGG